ncbi:MAG: S9 family peptidase [Hyphomonas sp.]|uniref:S9 family peptidase n=1 Tax=Hyphomonas sp. TaxID=87 RepID=UPI00181BDBE2|nr:S9 family peptidase [Hyphomonas sp.]MBA3070000.1 S9 family peptidase [Hyphomonas sp.]MBU4060424.1 S9 family peptidase [Alphaproteobacteria bacterium]MBU4163092.1 S9 family peptidase [Alphaproteobacteria bacterium]
MRLAAHLAGLAAVTTLFSGCTMTKTLAEPLASPLPAPPVAARVDHEITQLGHTRNDPYSWLKDENWQEVMHDPALLKPEIRGYLEAENAYTKARLEDPTAELRETLFNEMRGRIKEDDSSVPTVHGGWAYYTRFREGGEYAIYARKPAADAFSPDGEETILLDGDAMGKGQDYFAFGEIEASPDHKTLAYGTDTKGSEYYQIRIKNIETGEDTGVLIENAYGDFEWSTTGKAIFWVFRDANGRPSAVYQRDLASGEDTLIYEETDPGFFVGLSTSESEEVIFVSAGGHTTSETYWFPADELNPTLRLVAPRLTDNEYSVTHWDGAFYILTNLDGAVDFKLVKAPMTSSSRDDWEDVIPHRPGTLLLGTSAQKDYLTLMEREGGLPRIVIHKRGMADSHSISFGEAAFDLGLDGGYEYDVPVLRFDYASPSTPDQVYDYNLDTRERVLRKTREIPSGHNPTDYVVERILAPSWDGAEVPVTLLRHKDTPVDGTAPVLLYGYGSYGITIPADFRTGRLSLVDRGFIYAIVNPRGEMAKGYQWYLDGKLDKKTNTFKDFVAAGQYLVEKGYTKRGHLIGQGGSAGGLLMGAAANMDPGLFGGIVAAVPFVDVLNTMSDESLPLTPPEWPEWGNPLTDDAAYQTILAYSPYDNVTALDYPPMLITGGVTDPRVTYWEPSKWAAKLRHEAPDAGPYFLRINLDSGHFGASGRFEGLKEVAIEYAFALAAAGQIDTVDLGAPE